MSQRLSEKARKKRRAYNTNYQEETAASSDRASSGSCGNTVLCLHHAVPPHASGGNAQRDADHSRQHLGNRKDQRQCFSRNNRMEGRTEHAK